jgi:hypothetical protein
MKHIWKYIHCLAALLCAAQVQAQHTMSELQPVLQQLKSLERYSYENHTKAVFPNGQRDEMTTYIYMDKAAQRLSYSNKGETLLLNRNWIYKANHTARIAQVFKLSAYKKWNKGGLGDVQTLFRTEATTFFMDSLLMKSGRLASVERKAGLISYRILFAPEASLKEIQLVYNEQTQLPEKIYMKVSQQQNGRVTTSETWCTHYSNKVPETVFNEQQYFSVSKGQAVLLQNKHYKVYSAL